jgi:hypothetical protein
MSNLHISALCAASMLVFAACSKGEGVPRETLAEEGITSATEGADEGGDGDGDGPSTTMSFVPGDVTGENPSCDPWDQDCPEGEKCVAYAKLDKTWDANKCVPVLGTGQTGDECHYNGSAQGTDTCDVGYMCYYTNKDGIGICLPQCGGSPDTPMCPDQFNCSISNDGSLVLCVYRCDPLLQDCQQESAGCFWDGSKFNCDPAGTLLENEACNYINDCSPGYLCMDAASLPECIGSACCTAFCDLGDPKCLENGTECVAFFAEGSAPPGLENTGVCTLPGS